MATSFASARRAASATAAAASAAATTVAWVATAPARASPRAKTLTAAAAVATGATLFFYYRNQRLRRAARQAELLKEAEAAAPAPAPTASIASTPTSRDNSPRPSYLNAYAPAFTPSASTVASPTPSQRTLNDEDYAMSPSPLKLTPSARSALRQRLRSVVLTAESYVSAGGQLKPNDAEGFMAAGALLWLRGHPSVLGGAGPIVLMAAERREREAEVKLNFLGGKRDAVGESARDTAARECVEETGGLLSEGTRIRIESGGGSGGAVLWHANGKYALFVVECDAADTDLDRRVAALGRPPDPGDASLVSVRWVELRSLLDTRWCQANVHNFARDQLRYLRPTLRQMATKVGGPAAGLQRRPTAPRPAFAGA